MIMKKLLLLLIPLFIACEKMPLQPKKYILIIAGQSQAIGFGSNSDLRPEVKNYHFTRTKIWSALPDATQKSWSSYILPNYAKSNGWELLNIEYNQFFQQSIGNHGLEPYFAYEFEKNHPIDTLYIIKYAVGSTSLFQNTQLIDWNVNSRDEMYDHWVNDYLKPSLGSLGTYTPLGIIWMQGENDSVIQAAALTYYTNLTALFNTVNIDVPATRRFKKLIQQTIYFNVNGIYVNTVRDAQKKYSAENHATLFNCDDVTLISETNHHFNSNGYWQIVNRIYPLIMKN